jgi:hypothetical protein
MHLGHRPIHLAASCPQFSQTKIVVFFAIYVPPRIVFHT